MSEWEEQGFVVIRKAYSKERASTMVEALNDVIARGARGGFKRPLQWLDQRQGIPSFIPDLLSGEKYREPLGQFLDEAVLPLIEELIGPARCTWMTLFSNGGGHSYDLPWHRDFCPFDLPQEQVILERDLQTQCTFQTALKPNDNFLQLVPGSHTRPLNAAESEVLNSDPLSALPGQVVIELEPGDVVLRHGNILHRGHNPEGKPRWMMTSSLWSADSPIWTMEKQDYELLSEPGFTERLPGNLRVSVERFLNAFEQQTPRVVTEAGEPSDCEKETT